MITILRAAAYATIVLCTCPVASSADSTEDEKKLQRTLRTYISVTVETIKENYGPLLETAAMLAACESERDTPWLGPTEETSMRLSEDSPPRARYQALAK